MTRESSQTANESESNPGPVPSEGPTNNPVENLAERLTDSEAMSEDTAMFIAENWQRFVGLVFLAVLTVWLVDQFRGAVETKAGEASAKFTEIQKKFSASEAESNEAEKTAVVDSTFVLEESYSNSTYTDLAPLYLAKLKLNEKKFNESRELLLKLGAEKGLGQLAAVKSADANTLKIELASMLYAKSFLLEADSTDDPGKKNELVLTARKHLMKIAKKAKVVQAEATIAYLRSSQSPAEKEEAKVLAKEVAERSPELRDILNQQFARQGVNLS